MATNQLLPFANGDTANVLDFDSWNALAARLTGFQSGIASSAQFNRVLSQGAAAAYVIGEFIVENAGVNADINATELYRNFRLAMASVVPTGTIIMYAGKSVPKGFLLCNGAAVSRSQYADLFAAIGVTHGAGDGASTFNLPNLHRRFAEFTTSVGEVGQKVEAGLPDITGTFEIRRSFNNAAYFSVANPIGSFDVRKSAITAAAVTLHSTATTEQMEKVVFEGSRGNSKLGMSTTVQPPSVRLLPLIRI